MLLHANHASQNGFQTTVIVSEDTDVMILCLGYCEKINCPLYLKCGTQNRTRYINISNLAQFQLQGLFTAAYTACQLPGSSVEVLPGRTARHTRAKKTWVDN